MNQVKMTEIPEIFYTRPILTLVNVDGKERGLLKDEEVAKLIGRSTSYLRVERARDVFRMKLGNPVVTPKFIKHGNAVFYDIQDVVDFIEDLREGKIVTAAESPFK